MLRDVSNVNNWHFAMLNDVDRNAKFDLAIREAVAALAPEVGRVRVLDLGAGSGLLSMMAARAGADKVYAVERSALLSQLGPETLRRNGFGVGPGERVSWLAKSSRDVALADLDGAPCDVLVSETLGVTVLDEQALGFMADARARLLRARARAPGGGAYATIPRRVTTVAAVIRCDDLHELLHVDRAAGFDVRGVNSLRQSGGDGMRRSSRDFGFMLREVPHEIVAGPFEIFTIDFATDNATQFEGLRVVRAGRARSAGAIHAVVAWFEADLNPSGSISLSTSPWASDNSFARQQHWGQLLHVLPVDESGPSHVRAGDTIELSTSVTEKHIVFDKVHITPATAA